MGNHCLRKQSLSLLLAFLITGSLKLKSGFGERVRLVALCESTRDDVISGIDSFIRPRGPFQRRYGCRAMMSETVAAVPGIVGRMLLHCKSLRRFEHNGGWIKALLEEAENERMHLMTFMEVAKPLWYERALVITLQGIFFNAYFLEYLASPKLEHHVVGYLEEEAIHSYTEFLKELDKGKIENVPAPAIAIDYWRLSADSTLRDVVMVVRAGEEHHRDVNQFVSVKIGNRKIKRHPMDK